MSDYISREDAVDELQVKVFHDLTDEYYGTMQVLDELPAADVVPVVHGRWIKEYRAKGQVANMCTECGGETGRVSKYCPNCGAKMDGGEAE